MIVIENLYITRFKQCTPIFFFTQPSNIPIPRIRQWHSLLLLQRSQSQNWLGHYNCNLTEEVLLWWENILDLQLRLDKVELEDLPPSSDYCSPHFPSIPTNPDFISVRQQQHIRALERKFCTFSDFFLATFLPICRSLDNKWCTMIDEMFPTIYISTLIFNSDKQRIHLCDHGKHFTSTPKIAAMDFNVPRTMGVQCNDQTVSWNYSQWASCPSW